MGAMQQIYATHCTFGTSAIERREGEMAERVLGYSARSSSFTPADLRKHFRTFERYLSFNLWSDAPAELRTTLVAATAPKRMVFMPSVSGFQMLGHVAYRTWDTTGKRAGSYFAHLVVAERARDEAPWSILDCLRLWGAPGWQVEDSPSFSYDIPPLESFRGLWAAPPERAYEDPFEPVIGDDFLLRFLTQDELASGPGGTFLPSRWLAMPAHRRLELFRQALRGYLHIAGQGRDNAVLVAEPEVAALFFYGIARLLPDGELRHAISFSTFEGNLDRPATQLIATHFHDPFKTDLRPDRYQRGFALNTYLDGKATELRTPHPYAELILGRLTTDGWRAVDEVFAAFQAGGGKTVADLGELVRAGDLAEQFLDPAATLDIASLERNDFARRYVGKSLSTTLAGPALETLLRPLLDTADQRALALLKLLAGGPHAAACDESLRYVREHLPESQLPRFFELSEIPVDLKVRTLTRFVDHERRLPTGLEDLFDVALNAARVAPRHTREIQLSPLAAPLLRELRSETVRTLADQMPAASQPSFFVMLAEAVGPADEKQKWLRRMVVKGGNMSDESLSLAIERLGDRLDLLMPETRKEIGYRFIQVLNAIQRSPAEFTTRLAQLRRVKRLIDTMDEFHRDPSDLGPSWMPIDRLNAWERVPEVLKQARLTSQEKKTGWAALRGEGANDLRFRVGKQLAEALSRALPHNELRSEVTSQDKAVMMHNIIMELQGGDFIAPDWKSRAAYYLEYSHWYDTAAPIGRKSEAARRPWMFFGIGVGVATVLGSVLLFMLFGGDSGPPGRRPTGENQVAQGGTISAKSTAEVVTGTPVTKRRPLKHRVKDAAPKSIPSDNNSSESITRNPVNATTGAPVASPENPQTSLNPASPVRDKNSKDDDQANNGLATSVVTNPQAGAGTREVSKSKQVTVDLATPMPTAVKPEIGIDGKGKPNESPSGPLAPPMPEPLKTSERNFEIAEIPLPPPGALEDLLSDTPKPLGEDDFRPDINWQLWQDTNASGVEHELRVHGLKLATRPWTSVSVSLVKTPDKFVLRALWIDGTETDLMEFRLTASNGILTMHVPGLKPSLKELSEIQRQLFYCVIEIQSEKGSRYVALHPPSKLGRVSMNSSDPPDIYGVVRGRSNARGIAPRPLEHRLQRLYILRGALIMKDDTGYLFGSERGDWSAPAVEEWPLRPRQSGKSAPETECRVRFTQTTGSEAKLAIFMPPLPKEVELKQSIDTLSENRRRILEKRRVINLLRANPDNLAFEGASKLNGPVGELAKLCDFPELVYPRESDYPDPERGKRKSGKSPFDEAVEKYYLKLDELIGNKGINITNSMCDKKIKLIDKEIVIQKNSRDAFSTPRLATLEDFQAATLAARLELYRVVPREPREPNETPRLIRVPTVVTPSPIRTEAASGM